MNIMKWKITDPSCNQMMCELGDNKFEFKEDRVVNPETKETYTHTAVIDVEEYSMDEIIEAVKTFGYSELY